MIVTSSTVQTVTCDGSRSGEVATQTVPDAAASITAFSLLAPMIQINWQSSDRPASNTRSGATRPGGNQLTVPAGTQTIDTGAASGVPTLVTDGSISVRPSGSDTPGGSLGGPEQKEEASEGNNGLTTATKVGLGIAGGVAAIAVVVGTIMYVWRRRRNQREEQELDRLYGMKHNSSTNLTGYGDDEIPGWYRGQRQAGAATRLTPTASPFQAGPGGGGGAELEAPASPYYRPYRP